MLLKGLSDVSLEAGAAATALHLSVIGMFLLGPGSLCDIHDVFLVVCIYYEAVDIPAAHP